MQRLTEKMFIKENIFCENSKIKQNTSTKIAVPKYNEPTLRPKRIVNLYSTSSSKTIDQTTLPYCWQCMYNWNLITCIFNATDCLLYSQTEMPMSYKIDQMHVTVDSGFCGFSSCHGFQIIYDSLCFFFFLSFKLQFSLASFSCRFIQFIFT